MSALVFLLCLLSKLKRRFSQLLNSTAGILETRKFLKMDLILESKQSLDLDLQYPESHEMFLILSLTEWDTFLFPFCLAKKIIFNCWFNNFFFFNLSYCLEKSWNMLINVDDNEHKELLDMDCRFLLKVRWMCWRHWFFLYCVYWMSYDTWLGHDILV